MNGALIVARRELRGYFNSPLGYIFLVALLASTAVFFFFIGGFFAANQASMRSYFGLMPMILSILLPALTMRLWAEEKRQGTYETLVTLPFTEAQLVAGKYLAVMGVMGVALALTVPVPLMVSMFGSFDAGVICAQYAGVALLASAGAAIGQLISSATKNQMSAFLATALALVALNMAYQLVVWLPLPSWLAGAVNWLSLGYRYASFSRGVIDSRDVAYFAFLTAGSLYLTVRNLSAAKWR